MQEDFTREDLINIKEMTTFRPKGKSLTIDRAVSKAIGKTVYTTNPKLIQKIAQWKKQNDHRFKRGDDDIQQDNFLDDPKKVEELKNIL